jgi:hypothetical protein|nr:MAG TPA: Protein of unknown function (DUF2681) [Caudoviricetes sp.]
MSNTLELIVSVLFAASFIVVIAAFWVWAHGLEDRIETLEIRVGAAGRMATRASTDFKLYLPTLRKLGARVQDLEAEVADHRTFLNFIEDYTIEADVTGIQEVQSGCDCCNPELD